MKLTVDVFKTSEKQQYVAGFENQYKFFTDPVALVRFIREHAENQRYTQIRWQVDLQIFSDFEQYI